jgi:hypothetical protein
VEEMAMIADEMPLKGAEEALIDTRITGKVFRGICDFAKNNGVSSTVFIK